ncbi:myosin-9-like [Pollicipes pollicipes]|uniref:myosin-9-like n=1 Tax=Pollicipes pollicipes TaxID=41117 RepID=UPI001884AEFA|nr:myosin-9-like [Pollicipes pollicipes]
MECEQKPSRLRAKRTAARLHHLQERSVKVEQKPHIPGENKPQLQKPPARASAALKRRKAAPPLSDSAEVTQLKRKVDELQKCIAQLRETTQVGTARPGHPAATRPHRLLQGKMSGLPTLREGERYDSLEDPVTAVTEHGSDVSDIKPSDLAELSRQELQRLCCQLQRAHQQLRQAHDLLVAQARESSRTGRTRSRVENELLASQEQPELEARDGDGQADGDARQWASHSALDSLVRDLEAALASKGVDPSSLQEKSLLTAQNLCLTQQLRRSRARELRAENELQELRDANELMEFRILELEGCQEKPSDPVATAAAPALSRLETAPSADTDADDSQTLEAAGEDRRRGPTPAAIEPPQRQQPDSLGEERHQWQQKIAELQCTVLRLEAALEEANAQQAVPPTLEPEAHASPAPAALTSGHQRQPSGNSESELSDYHSDSNDGRPARRSLLPGVCTCGRPAPAQRPLASPEQQPLQESGIFDVDCDEKAVQTEVQESDVSMRELIDLSSEIARLTSVQEQLEKSPLPIASRIRHHDTERAEEVAETVTPTERLEQAPAARTALICAEAQTDYSHDQLLCDYKDMCDRYEKVKKTKEAVEDEKNELEEAENDARLMVQRLEMKIFASTEVEKMLSLDLAEEQERCRQLQRQLNSVKLKHQADLKARQADLGRQRAAHTTERIQQLETQVQELTARLQEAKQRPESGASVQPAETAAAAAPAGAWELWRAGEASSSDTLSSAEPCGASSASSLPLTSPVAAANTDSLTKHLDQAWSFNDSGVGEDLSRLSAVSGDTARVAPPASRPAKRPRTEAAAEDADAASVATDTTVCAECTKRLAQAGASAAANNSLDSNVSERESYYSECIQELETQKSELRKRWDDEKSSMLKEVEDSCQKSCELKQKLDEIQREGEAAKETLTKKVAQLKLELKQQAKNSEIDREELIKSNAMKSQSLQEQQVLLKRRMRAAEDVLNALKVEFDLCQLDSGRDSPDPGYALVLERVRTLHQSQKHLANQVHELEKKEGAYRETLQEADKIMHTVEVRYQKKIEELEDQLREDKNKITLMEETESKLKQALKSMTNGKHDKDRVTDLLDKLIETENEDLKLKEKVYRLERRERELSIRLREEERTAEGLRHELRDQEELLRELDGARRELGAATEQLAVLAALRQRSAELQQSEEFLRGRIEELEQAELALQETLRSVKTAQAHKERRSAEQVSALQQDLETLQATVQELQQQATEDGEERSRLRRQLQDVHRDLETTNGTATETEAQLRNEVCKLRNQLSLVNSQLNDNDSYSCQLRDQLEKAQSENSELRSALDGQKSRTEQDIIQLNLEISRREEEIGALSEQLAELDKGQLAGELDLLADQEGALVKLLSLAKQSNDKIQSCDTCAGEVDGALRAVIQQLEQLTLLLSGSHSEQSLQSQLRDAESLAAAAQPEPPPTAVSVAVQADGAATDAAQLAGRMSAAALVRGLREHTAADADRQDFDREMVCQILQQIVTVMRERVLRSRSSQNASPDQTASGSRIPRLVPRSRENTPPCSPHKIIRAVGGDSLLLYWSPSDDPRISGYEVAVATLLPYRSDPAAVAIFVNNRLQQLIRNPQRTKP